MAIPSSREDVKEYCLRELGSPVVDINVTDNQIEDRLDDAIRMFQQNHYDGIERTYVKHKITISSLVFVSVSGTFEPGEIITGATSGTTAKIRLVDGSSIQFYRLTGTNFTSGETISGSVSGATGTITSSTLGDIDNEYFIVPDNILSVTNISQVGGTGGSSDYMFDIGYQTMLSAMADVSSIDLVSYSFRKSQVNLIQQLLQGTETYNYNRKQNRIYIRANWKEQFRVGSYIVAEVYAILDPEQWVKIYSDELFLRYCTQLFKKQWGENLKKFGGIVLPGGVTLNGKQIYDEAVDELKALRIELEQKYSEPPMMFMA